MEIVRCAIEGLIEIQPRVFHDPRGYFLESFNREVFEKAGLPVDFVQDNQSLSSAGVLRGLHFQAPPHAQGKLVRVITGKVLDVVVDLRRSSPTYGQHHQVLLDSSLQNMFFIPPGFAHGFITLEDNTIFSYKCTNVYNKASEGGIFWNDPELKINWGIENPLVSDKDMLQPLIKDFRSPFE
jgi:dTDP-4-dehydrorhamnose 3,5-epimerase